MVVYELISFDDDYNLTYSFKTAIRAIAFAKFYSRRKRIYNTILRWKSQFDNGIVSSSGYGLHKYSCQEYYFSIPFNISKDDKYQASLRDNQRSYLERKEYKYKYPMPKKDWFWEYKKEK